MENTKKGEIEIIRLDKLLFRKVNFTLFNSFLYLKEAFYKEIYYFGVQFLFCL